MDAEDGCAGRWFSGAGCGGNLFGDAVILLKTCERRWLDGCAPLQGVHVFEHACLLFAIMYCPLVASRAIVMSGIRQVLAAAACIGRNLIAGLAARPRANQVDGGVGLRAAFCGVYGLPRRMIILPARGRGSRRR